MDVHHRNAVLYRAAKRIPTLNKAISPSLILHCRYCIVICEYDLFRIILGNIAELRQINILSVS